MSIWEYGVSISSKFRIDVSHWIRSGPKICVCQLPSLLWVCRDAREVALRRLASIDLSLPPNRSDKRLSFDPWQNTALYGRLVERTGVQGDLIRGDRAVLRLSRCIHRGPTDVLARVETLALQKPADYYLVNGQNLAHLICHSFKRPLKEFIMVVHYSGEAEIRQPEREATELLRSLLPEYGSVSNVQLVDLSDLQSDEYQSQVLVEVFGRYREAFEHLKESMEFCRRSFYPDWTMPRLKLVVPMKTLGCQES